MQRLADTNILLRYLLGEDEPDYDKASKIIEDGVSTLPESIAEIIYVLARVYSIPRQQIADVILLLLDDIEIEDKECIKEAVRIYQDSKLDYVDCLYISKAERTGAELLSFDRKLMNLYKKRNNINS